MAEFDPDAYLAAKTGGGAAVADTPAFDPDAYLKSKAATPTAAELESQRAPEGSPAYLAKDQPLPIPEDVSARPETEQNVFDAYRRGGIEGVLLSPRKASDLLEAAAGRKLPEATTVPSKVAKALATAPLSVADFLTTPEGLGTLALGATGPIAQTAIAGGFGLQGANQTIKSLRTGDVEGATGGALMTLLSGLGLKAELQSGAPHATELQSKLLPVKPTVEPPPPIEVTPNAVQIPETAQPDGLRTRPEVPQENVQPAAAVSSERVPASGQGNEVLQAQASPDAQAEAHDVVPAAAPGSEIGQKTWYHGTGNAPEVLERGFDPTKLRDESRYGKGFYFTDSPRVASNPEYTGSAKGAAVVPARLDVKNPFRTDAQFSWDDAAKIAEQVGRNDVSEALKSGQQFMAERPETNWAKGLSGAELYRKLISGEEDSRLTHDELNARLQKLGFDGITYTDGEKTGGEVHNVTVVFDPNLIRSGITGKKFATETPTEAGQHVIGPVLLDKNGEVIAAALEAFAADNGRGFQIGDSEGGTMIERDRQTAGEIADKAGQRPEQYQGEPLHTEQLNEGKDAARAAEWASYANGKTQNLPQWLREEITRLNQNAETSGVADKIEELSAQRQTAKQVASALGIEQDTVRAVRSKRGIPAMDDKADFESWLNNRGRPAAASEPATTGIAQRVHEERAATGKQGEILPGEGTTAEEMIQRGRELLKAGADPEAIIAGVSQGKAVTGDEMATLRARHEELSKATDAAADAARKTPNDPVARQAYETAFKAETDFAQRIKPAATEWHKVGQSMQGETEIQTGSFNGLRRAFVERTGRDVTAKEAAKLEKTADKVKRVTDDLEKAKQAYREVVGNETKGRSVKTVEDLRQHFADRIRSLTPC